MTPADLKAIRESFGFSQAHFARLLRVDRATWHQWESGRHSPPAIAITAIQMLLFLRERGMVLDWMEGC